MVKRVTSVLTICLATTLMMGSAIKQPVYQASIEDDRGQSSNNSVAIDDQIKQLKSTIVASPRVLVTSAEENEEPNPEPEILSEEPTMSEDDIELIALVTMGEAEGECEEGKRLVIDTILNRVDYDLYFPNTVREVIYQRNQFECVTNGRLNRCYVDEYFCQLVREELEYRTNYDVMYFRAYRYGEYGTPMFQVGNHYFSSN